MSVKLKESLEGAGIGLVAGLVIGISQAEWLRVVLALALIAYAGKVLQGNKPVSAGGSYKAAFTGIASFFAILIGLYIHGQQLFEHSPKEAINTWIEAGYSPQQSRALYLKLWEREMLKENPVPPHMDTLMRKVISETGADSVIPQKVTTSSKE